MRIAITTSQAPFVSGGAEALERGLCRVLKDRGHEVALIAYPLRYGDVRELTRIVDIWSSESLQFLSGPVPDRVIALKFPAYYASHPNTVIWLLHQHKPFYEEWDPLGATPEELTLSEKVTDLDRRAFDSAKRLYAISQTVGRRANRQSAREFGALYPPLENAEGFYCEEPKFYVFAPGRLEPHKRQSLLIEALKYTTTQVNALIAGEGGQEHTCRQQIADLGLHDRVKLLGRIDDGMLRAAYAHANAVFFGPLNEDFGYVTVEAMLSSKPVITCDDSGGPLELIGHEEHGLVVPPDPRAIAAALDRVCLETKAAQNWGKAGRERVDRLCLDWNHVVDSLLAD